MTYGNGMGTGSLFFKLTICAAATVLFSAFAGAAPQLFEWQNQESGHTMNSFRKSNDQTWGL